MDVTSTEFVDQRVEEREAANKNYRDICIKRGLSNRQYKT